MSEAGKRAQARLKAQHGLDEDGKSLFHKGIGREGGKMHKKSSYFAQLAENDPDKLAEISRKANRASLKQRKLNNAQQD